MSATVSSPLREAPQYEDFYGFVKSPFTLAPDPRFLYLSESHNAALQLLLQAIRRKEGVVVLTGDIGTGKTTVSIDRTNLGPADCKATLTSTSTSKRTYSLVVRLSIPGA